MIYPYHVKHNGVNYAPGDNVPIEGAEVKPAPSKPSSEEPQKKPRRTKKAEVK